MPPKAYGLKLFFAQPLGVEPSELIYELAILPKGIKHVRCGVLSCQRIACRRACNPEAFSGESEQCCHEVPELGRPCELPSVGPRTVTRIGRVTISQAGCRPISRLLATPARCETQACHLIVMPACFLVFLSHLHLRLVWWRETLQERASDKTCCRSNRRLTAELAPAVFIRNGATHLQTSR